MLNFINGKRLVASGFLLHLFYIICYNLYNIAVSYFGLPRYIATSKMALISAIVTIVVALFVCAGYFSMWVERRWPIDILTAGYYAFTVFGAIGLNLLYNFFDFIPYILLSLAISLLPVSFLLLLALRARKKPVVVLILIAAFIFSCATALYSNFAGDWLPREIVSFVFLGANLLRYGSPVIAAIAEDQYQM